MFTRKLLWVALVGLAVCVIAFAGLSLGSHLYTARVLARWDEEKAGLTGPLLTLPPAGEDTFLSSTTLGFAPLCNLGTMSTVVAEGPTTIQRGDPVTLPGGRKEFETEMVQLDLRGTFQGGPLVGPVSVRESPDLRTRGKVTQIKPGQDFPATSFFDVYFEAELDVLGATVTLFNHADEPAPMRRIILSIPPVWVDYLPPPDFLVHLYDKATGAYWGCMIHPKHLTKPPIIKVVSILDPDFYDTVDFKITLENPYSNNGIPAYFIDRLHDPLSGGSLIVDPASLQAEPGEVYLVGNDQLAWENDADPTTLDPVILGPRHRAVITFTAQIMAAPGVALPNVIEGVSEPLGWDPTRPITLATIMPGHGGNLTGSSKEAQPFVNPGDTLTYTIELSNSGALGMAHASLFDPIPDGAVYVPGSVGGGASYDPMRDAIVLDNLPIPPDTAQDISFQVQVMSYPGSCITNTAVITDNWGNSRTLHAWTVVVDNAVPGKLNFVFERTSFPIGAVAPIQVRVVDEQGAGVPDGVAVTLTSSGGALSPPSGSTLFTHNGAVDATLTSNLAGAIAVVATTGNGLAAVDTFHFVFVGYLPLVVKNWD